MEKKVTTYEVVICGLLLCSGLIIPTIFHMFGFAGPMLLPMHIPILIGGFLLSPRLSLLLGIMTPLMSSLLTGMPLMFPIALIMASELGAYGITASIATRKYKLSIYSSLIVSMLIGRVVAGIAAALLVQLFSIKMNPLIYIKGAIITGLPGIIIQILFIPPLVSVIRLYMKRINFSE